MTVSVSQPGELADENAFLDSVEGELSFFRSIMCARPIGMHRHFHILTIRNAIFKDTGRSVHIESIWAKLKQCYDLDALEAIDIESQGYVSPRENSTPVSIRSPSPSENLAAHPFFREEFALPYEDFEPIIAQRRLRATASLPSSPAPSHRSSARPSAPPTSASTSGGIAAIGAPSGSTSAGKRGGAARKRGKNAKSKLNLAGLIAGDSDSSALTQESGDEGAGVPETPRESVVTGTDVGTDYGEDEDVEMREASPTQDASPKPTRGRARGGKRGRGASTRGAATTTRGKKKTKR